MIKMLALLMIFIMMLAACAAPNKAAIPEAAPDFERSVSEVAPASVTDDSFPASDANQTNAETVPLVCAVFSQDSRTATADDGTKLFSGQWNLPSLYSGETKTDTWLAGEMEQISREILTISDNISDQAVADYEEMSRAEMADSFYAYSYRADVRVERMDGAIISLRQNDSVYNGGATADNKQFSFNFDLKNRVRLSLSDIILPEALAHLQELVLEQLCERLESVGELNLSPDHRKTIEAGFVPEETKDNWYFSGRGLVFYINSDQLVTNLAGFAQIVIPYDSLDAILRPEYKPVYSTGIEGEMGLLEHPGEREVLLATKGESIVYLAATAVVYDVQISEISSWITEDLPIAGRTIYSANRVTGAESICLGFDGQNPEYILTFKTASGVERVYAISSEAMVTVDSYAISY